MRPLRIVIGWDPGPTKSAYAILLQGGSLYAVSKFVVGETVTNDRLAEGFAVVEAHAWDMGLGLRDVTAAIEAPGGYIFHQARGAQLLKTSHVAGELATIARMRGLVVIEKSAQEWRRKFCGRANATDAMVKQRCVMFVRELPRRSSAHMRDAIGVAWASL